MTLGYVSKLGLKVCLINIRVQKIDGSILKMFEMVPASFAIEDKLRRAWFFQKTFLLTNFNIEIVLRMPFLTPRYTNIEFVQKKLIWNFYTTANALPTTKQIEIINKKEIIK